MLIYNGKKVKIETDLSDRYGAVILTVLEDPMGSYTPGSTLYANKYDLKPEISLHFQIGDDVRNIHGVFTGKIVGWDVFANKAICVSHKIHRYRDDRTRYAYGQDELAKINMTDAEEVVLGEKLVVTDRIYTVVMDGNNRFALLDENYKIQFSDIPKGSTIYQIAKRIKRKVYKHQSEVTQ